MRQPAYSSGMRTFFMIWFGQMVSTIGSAMTTFAITIWLWQATGQATSLALVSFFSLLPSIVITALAGTVVDRSNRKFLMMLGDTIAVLSTVGILLLLLTNHLQIWHFYVRGAINGAFSEIQTLAYSASITMLVPKQQYTRASSMNSCLHYGSIIVAPALAGVLYPSIGLLGIGLIDMVTFAIAISTVFKARIPQPVASESPKSEKVSLRKRWQFLQEMAFGFQYILARPGMLAVLAFGALFWLAHDIGGAIYSPMILARSGNDATVLGNISAAAGFGGVMGAVLLSVWGGFHRRIDGFLLGMVGAGISKIIFGFGQTPLIWIPAQFCSSLNFPVLGSSEDAIWLSKVKPDVQGRVFATRSVSVQIVSAIAVLIGGILADKIFEPAMMPGGSLALIFAPIFGTGSGAGIALLYVLSSICLLLVGLSGYAIETLRNVEKLVPDSQ